MTFIPTRSPSHQRRIDALHLEHTFAGSRMLRDLLRQEGVTLGRKHAAMLMRRMGIEALYRKPNTSRRAQGQMQKSSAACARCSAWQRAERQNTRKPFPD